VWWHARTETLSQHNQCEKGQGDVAQVVEHLPSKHKVQQKKKKKLNNLYGHCSLFKTEKKFPNLISNMIFFFGGNGV
jgi:hypothetical protein